MNEKAKAVIDSSLLTIAGSMLLGYIPELGGVILFLTGIYAGKKSENLKWRGL